MVKNDIVYTYSKIRYESFSFLNTQRRMLRYGKPLSFNGKCDSRAYASGGAADHRPTRLPRKNVVSSQSATLCMVYESRSELDLPSPKCHPLDEDQQQPQASVLMSRRMNPGLRHFKGEELFNDTPVSLIRTEFRMKLQGDETFKRKRGDVLSREFFR